jgi:hypothetical protein
MARRLGFHESVYGKIERGDRVLDVIEFIAFANAVDLDPELLLRTFIGRMQKGSRTE